MDDAWAEAEGSVKEVLSPPLTVGWRIVFQYHKVSVGILGYLPSPCGFKPGLATVPCLLSSKTVLGSGTIQRFGGKTGQLNKQAYV